MTGARAGGSSTAGMTEPLPTLTLAEMYARQGLLGRAREIYRRLAEAGSPEARERLQGLGPDAQGEVELLRELISRVQSRRRR